MNVYSIKIGMLWMFHQNNFIEKHVLTKFIFYVCSMLTILANDKIRCGWYPSW